MEAYQLSSRAAHIGVDWKKLEDLFDKMREEMSELSGEAAREASSSDTLARHAALDEEAGDMLFTAVNVARFLKLDPESALLKTNRKFRSRFQWMEQELKK